MRVAVLIDTVAALKAGKNAAGARVLTFDPADLTQAERDILARKCDTSRPRYFHWEGTDADLWLTDGPGPRRLTEPTLDELRRVLAESVAEAEAEAARGRERERAEAEKRAARDREYAAGPIEPRLVTGRHEGGVYLVQPDPYYLNPDNFPLTAARRPEVEAYCAAENERRTAATAEEQARAAEEQARAEREKAERLEALAAWARVHGSERVRLQLAGGFDRWAEHARNEFAAAAAARFTAGLGLTEATAPDGYTEGDDDDRQNPTVPEMRTLAVVRERGAGDPAFDEARLAWVKYDPTPDPDGYGDDDDEKPIGRGELVVWVKCPDGTAHAFYYLVPEGREATVAVEPAEAETH